MSVLIYQYLTLIELNWIELNWIYIHYCNMMYCIVQCRYLYLYCTCMNTVYYSSYCICTICIIICIRIWNSYYSCTGILICIIQYCTCTPVQVPVRIECDRNDSWIIATNMDYCTVCFGTASTVLERYRYWYLLT